MSTKDNERRIARERRIVGKLVNTLMEAGWLPFETNDGDADVPTRTKKKVVEIVFSVDLSIVRFEKVENGKTLRHRVLLACGNDRDIIADYGYPVTHEKFFDDLYDKLSDYTEALR